MDGNVFVMDKEKGPETKELIEQAKVEEDPVMRKALLESAGLEVLDVKDMVI